MAQPKRKIKAKQIVEDVKTGLTDMQIMAKHELSPNELANVLEKLVHLELISQRELDQRNSARRPEAEPLMVCPACGKQYEKDFTQCPECGFTDEHETVSRPAAADIKPVDRESSVGRTATFAVAAVVVLIAIAAVVTYFLVKRQKEAQLAKIERTRHFLTLEEKAEAYAGQNELSGIVALSSMEEVREALGQPDLDVDAPDIDDRTLLMVAAEYGRFEVAKLLVYYGANMYATDPRGNTPAHIATKAGHIDILDLLVDKGYDVDFKNLAGETVRSLSHATGDEKLKQVVIKGTKLPKTDRIAIFKMWRARRLTSLKETCMRLCAKRIKRRRCVETCMKYYDLGEADRRVLH